MCEEQIVACWGFIEEMHEVRSLPEAIMSAVRIAFPVAASDFSPPGLTIVQSYDKIVWL